jgi:UDP-glucose:(heptosyl)LPS alpha-1,3-glucosyltransferase
LRIAVLNRQFTATGGGAERYSMALVEHLASDHEVHVFAQLVNHTWPGVTYHTVSQVLTRPRWLNQLWYATAVWWATRKGFDVVHSHENTWHGNVQTMHVVPVKYNLFHGLGGARLAMRCLKVLTSPRLLVYLMLEHYRLSAGTRGAVVLASETLRTQMLEAYPACQPAIQVVTPGVEHVHGAASAQEKSDARARLGLPKDGFCILFVGNDYRKKGLNALLAALQQLPASSFLAVVGNPAQAPHFKALAATTGLAHRVYFLGSLHDVTQAYLAADCLAHPTLEDTFAMVVLEAMAHGLPVLVSDARHCGIAALLQPGRDAIVLSDPHDSQEIAKAIAQFVQQPQLRQDLQTAGLKFAELHRWETSARQQALIYQQIAR